MTETKRDRFEEPAKRKNEVKCLCTINQERELTKGTDYERLPKKHLGSGFFSLRESTTQRLKYKEWREFVEARTSS